MIRSRIGRKALGLAYQTQTNTIRCLGRYNRRDIRGVVAVTQPFVQKRHISLFRVAGISDNGESLKRKIQVQITMKQYREEIVMEFIKKLQRAECKQDMFITLLKKKYQFTESQDAFEDLTSIDINMDALKEAKCQMILYGLWNEKDLYIDDLTPENKYAIECIQKLSASKDKSQTHFEMIKTQCDMISIEENKWFSDKDVVDRCYVKIGILHDIKYILIKQNKWEAD